MSIKDLLEQYKNSNCQECGLKDKRTLIAPYRGNPEAKIIGIGEAPGKHEDLEGKTFIGPAGKLLDDCFAQAGIDTNENMLLVNTVMCRPKAEDYDTKENRQPLIEEIATCLPKLKNIINTAQPSLIVLFGVPALRTCIPDGPKRIGVAVGKFFPPAMHIFDCDCDIYAMYHPSYVLRYRKAQAEFMNSIYRMKHYSKGLGVL